MSGFIYGSFYNIEWALDASLFFLWITAFMGTITLFWTDTVINTLDKDDVLRKLVRPVPKIFENTFDVAMLILIVSQSYYFLSVFYFIHMLGFEKAHKKVEERLSKRIEIT